MYTYCSKFQQTTRSSELMLTADPVQAQPLPLYSASLGRILLVEDEDSIRETVALALTDEGYDVISMSHGREALNFLQHRETRLQLKRALDGFPRQADEGVMGMASCSGTDIDLIILDLMLPQVNGLDLCRYLRRSGNNVPIMILSAKGSETDRVVGLELGADDYITKPFGMRELVARCRALLRRARHVQAPIADDVIRYLDITLYLNECRVTVRGDVINLSPKEFKILEMFMNAPKRVWSREQLLERVWGADFVGDSKTVDVHIRWLREKIELDPSHPVYLQTVRGFGYRLG
jgi:two-component system, OmpR family, phosphate regulon response regulator PhoB